MKILEVLLPKPFDSGFDYAVPEGVSLNAGDYVRVMFGKQEMVGVVWGAARGDVAPEKIKPIQEKLDFLPPMPEPLRKTIDWVANYTLSPRGMVLKMAVPEISKQKEKYSALSTQYLEEQHPVLSSEQATAANKLADTINKGFSVTLLDGLTGSGKTEVYFDTIEKVIGGQETAPVLNCAPCERQDVAQRGQLKNSQVLVLLPEIALSVQWVERCKTRFGFAPTIWHSGLTPAQRRDNWRRIASGEAKLVVGARSALFLPFANLKLIVVDEEQEASYKQEDGVQYQARDMAVARASQEKIPIILASATPSLETVLNVKQGRYSTVHLPQRHGGVHLPKVKLVDMRDETLETGHFLSPQLKTVIAETLGRNKQVMLFLNRRGYAPLLLCRSCGHRFACPVCTGWMVLHRPTKKRGQETAPALSGALLQNQEILQGAKLKCHYCGHQTKVPKQCPSCEKEETFVACGPGVERVAEEVQEAFPQARIAMMSSDTTASLSAAQQLVHDMAEHKIDILVGTQMMAKGYHFPALHLIGVVDADLGLAGGDLRAAERTYQLLHQVAGRAGREAEQGEVWLQTYQPDHPVMQALKDHDRLGLEKQELAARENAGFPPFGRLAAIVIDGMMENEVAAACRALATKIPQSPHIRVLGPAPAPLARLRGRYRYRFLIKAEKTAHLQHYLRVWLGSVPVSSKVRVRVDVDPYGFL